MENWKIKYNQNGTNTEIEETFEGCGILDAIQQYLNEANDIRSIVSIEFESK